jgi:hypothetical protein
MANIKLHLVIFLCEFIICKEEEEKPPPQQQQQIKEPFEFSKPSADDYSGIYTHPVMEQFKSLMLLHLSGIQSMEI